MAALDYLSQAGLTVELEGERLRVSPADRLTTDLRQFIRENRTELLSELIAANDPRLQIRELTRTAWRITRAGKSIGYIAGKPMSYGEALASARWHWPDAEIQES